VDAAGLWKARRDEVFDEIAKLDFNERQGMAIRVGWGHALMPLLPWGEYKPDVADYEGAATKNILNVVPRGDGYGPFPSFAAATLALPAACRGGFLRAEI
jgi:hypothetical protein